MISGPYGEDTIIKENYIDIAAATPVARFSADLRSGFPKLSVQFTDSSSGIIDRWLWNFGDGETSTDQNPVHAYQAAGDFPVTLAVQGPGGADTLVIADFIHVMPVLPPSSAFSADPVSGTAPLTVQFTNESTGSILEYKWYFGDTYATDGGTSVEVNPVYTYANPGVYSVILTAVGPDSTDVELVHNLIEVLESSAAGSDARPERFFLYQNFPNPFNMQTVIRYDVPQMADVSIAVYDARGEKVRDLVNAAMPSGQHTVSWNGTGETGQVMPSGIYIVRMHAGAYHHDLKAMLLK